ncbi:hypothetical protein EJ06DRAFT_531521 [Trichodelitschia bisporula]|uniref:Jacalin-type lectin domain-containing protein n=1 Tax=Trichodelitschia bisporula TaxID=703511 RepID=A0A6G1HTG7_9PEZI|nr:hypothetical protein EJ06DRAFT_531521 [Trichodelitschia bisporula]
MSLTAPYSNELRLGQGFNSYTHEPRLQGAVRIVLHNPENEQVSKAEVSKPEVGVEDPDTSVPSVPEVNGTGHNGPTNGIAPKELANGSTNMKLIASAEEALYNPSSTATNLPFTLVPAPLVHPSQNVTFSTRAIENVSDIMDALNISTAISIKYGTIHGNASAGFVNESKVLESQLNYLVSVKVNNNSRVEPDVMEFQPIENIPPESFTEIYGDCFVSGFLEGGEFNAVISVSVQDKSKVRQVKQSIDLQLAVGPSPLSVGGSESVEKQHAELLQDTEITISVNWAGGGEVKKPEAPWTISSVMAVAHAFPSMVARCSSKTSAILTRYTSLRSFQEWRYKEMAENPKFGDKNLILNYAPCSVYTTDLFDALMAYKKLWKQIDTIMQDMSKWRARDPVKSDVIIKKPVPFGRNQVLSPMPQTPLAREGLSPLERAILKTNEEGCPGRSDTFHVDDPLISLDFDLAANNASREPIPLDPTALNEARLLCREAMTLITEEAARLVNHPDLAYADFDGKTGKTRMKRPNYAFPEVLRERLPIPAYNDAAHDSLSRDPASAVVQSFSHNEDLFAQMTGDEGKPHGTYRHFVSLEFNERRDHGNILCNFSIHAHHHHKWNSASRFSKAADGCIGAIGFRFVNDTELKADGCAVHTGRPHFDQPSRFKIYRPSGKIPESAEDAMGLDIAQIEVYYVPDSGMISGLAFFDKFGDQTGQALLWKAWGAGKLPTGMKKVVQKPPEDGEKWTLVGLMGYWDDSALFGSVLNRIGGVWRKC